MIESNYNIPNILPPKVHPRLLLTEKDLPRIRQNMQKAENAYAVSVLDELCASEITGNGPTPQYSNYNLKEVLACEALGFKALLSNQKEDAEKAISTIIFLLENIEIVNGNMGARWCGHLIFTASLIYDWCYKYLTDTDKQKIISISEEKAAAYFEMGYPPSKQTAVSGHGTEAQLLRDLLSFSIAVYDERSDIYNFCAGRILDEYVPTIPKIFSEGAHNQGPTYGSYRYTSLCWCELIFRAMSGISLFPCLEKIGEWLLYILRPDGECLRLGDDFNETKAEYNRKNPLAVPFFFSYAISGRTDFEHEFRDGLCREFLLPLHHGMDYYAEGSWGEGLISAVSMLIFDGFTQKKPAPDLPYSKYFGTPVGETVYKRDDTLIFMKIGEYWGANHDHLDTGCFQVFRGAPLLTDSGVYDSYSTPHRRMYLTHTAAHNCLTVERTDRNVFGEWKSEYPYDGGVRRPENGHEVLNAELMYEKYHMADVICHEESENGCRIAGDLSHAYMHSCSHVKRSMEYNHLSHTLTVCDDVTSLEPEYKKTFHIHTQTEPIIEGNEITVTNKGCSCKIRVLEPQNAVITKIGGKGHQFEIEGCNIEPNPPYTAEEGWGEIRITPSELTLNTQFKVEITTLDKVD